MISLCINEPLMSPWFTADNVLELGAAVILAEMLRHGHWSCDVRPAGAADGISQLHGADHDH